jgi:hypothetical protein
LIVKVVVDERCVVEQLSCGREQDGVAFFDTEGAAGVKGEVSADALATSVKMIVSRLQGCGSVGLTDIGRPC